MIPTAILGGLVIGRWWAVPLMGAFFVLLVTVDGSCRGTCSTSAFVLAGINATFGVAVHIRLRHGLRRYRGIDPRA